MCSNQSLASRLIPRVFIFSINRYPQGVGTLRRDRRIPNMGLGALDCTQEAPPNQNHSCVVTTNFLNPRNYMWWVRNPAAGDAQPKPLRQAVSIDCISQSNANCPKWEPPKPTRSLPTASRNLASTSLKQHPSDLQRVLGVHRNPMVGRCWHGQIIGSNNSEQSTPWTPRAP